MTFDFQEILTRYFLPKNIDVTIKKVKNIVSAFNSHTSSKYKSEMSIEFDNSILESRLELYYKDTSNWLKEIKFRDLEGHKSVFKVFEPVDFYLRPKKVHTSKKSKRILFSEALNIDARNTIIIGLPGSGKTTLMKFICSQENQKVFDERRFRFSLVLRLKEYHKYKTGASNQSLYSLLASYFGIKTNFVFPPDKIEVINDLNKTIEIDNPLYSEAVNDYYAILHNVVLTVLEELNILLILDGLDEIPDLSIQAVLIKDFQDLAYKLSLTRMILTSRTGEFNYTLDNVDVFEICPLTYEQIKSIIFKTIDDAEQALQLFDKIKVSPYFDTSIRPLHLAHICAIYESDGDLPEKPNVIYSRIIELLLYDWSRQRLIERTSKYGKFSVEEKSKFLKQLAYMLTIDYQSSVFDKKHVREVYNQICVEYGLPKNEANSVVDELESHNGLFVNCGFNVFEFSHKSLQEYLCACYIVDNDIDAKYDVFEDLPNELALVISLSNNPNIIFANIILDQAKQSSFNLIFLGTLLRRMISEKIEFTDHVDLALTLLYMYSNTILSLNHELNDSILDFFEYIKKQPSACKSFNKIFDIYDLDLAQNKLYLKALNEKSYNHLPVVILVDQYILQFLEVY